jgi:hypothetical protein
MDALAKLLEPTKDKKPARVTVPLTEADMALIDEVRKYLGKSNAAEIARKGIRLSLMTALESLKPKAG